MTVWAALLRGVNVGGHGKLPMADFRALMAGLGLQRPETFIQSGNAVFGSGLERAELSALIADGIAAQFGFCPTVLLRDRDEMIRAADHPFPGAEPAKVHAFFLQTPCGAVDAAAVDALAAQTEAWALAGDIFYLSAPNGVGRSALANALHRVVPGVVTARNLRTVCAVAALMQVREADTPA